MALSWTSGHLSRHLPNCKRVETTTTQQVPETHTAWVQFNHVQIHTKVTSNVTSNVTSKVTSKVTRCDKAIASIAWACFHSARASLRNLHGKDKTMFCVKACQYMFCTNKSTKTMYLPWSCGQNSKIMVVGWSQDRRCCLISCAWQCDYGSSCTSPCPIIPIACQKRHSKPISEEIKQITTRPEEYSIFSVFQHIPIFHLPPTFQNLPQQAFHNTSVKNPNKRAICAIWSQPWRNAGHAGVIAEAKFKSNIKNI